VTWPLLSLWRSIQLLKQGRALVGLWRRAVPLDLASDCLESAGQTGRKVEICTSTEVEAPSIIGFFQPRLLIPAWMLGKLTSTDLQHMAMHELEHLRRYDDWMNLLQKIALICWTLGSMDGSRANKRQVKSRGNRRSALESRLLIES
jgi:beta-lactamase regulating signal transducer with metallopeptidase domain